MAKDSKPTDPSRGHEDPFDVLAPALAQQPAATIPSGLPDPPLVRAAAPVTWRCILLGLALVLAIAILTPVNDYVLNNNPLIGNHLPVGILTPMIAIVLLLNPLLVRLKRKPFAMAELVVILSMMLVGSAAPSSGLTRYLEPSILQPAALLDPDKSGESFRFLEPIRALLPGWFGPIKDSSAPVIRMYTHGVDPVLHQSIPVLSFLLPALWWSILIASLFGAMVLIAALFRRQWVHHERLSYPLAVVQMELLANPERGQSYNRLWRNPVLWAGIAIPCFVCLLGGLHSVWPAVPGINLEFDHTDKFTEIPWSNIPAWITRSKIYFSAVGLAFFLPSEVGLSFWLLVLISGLAHALLLQRGIDTSQGVPVRGIGAYAVYFLAILWMARRHLAHAVRSAWKNAAREESEFAKHRTLLLGLIGCTLVGMVWLMAAGVGPGSALLLLLLGAMIATLMARVVAETGLFFLGLQWQIIDVFSSLLGPKLISISSFYISDVVSKIFFGDVREILSPYAANSLRMGSELRPPARPSMLRWMFGAIFLSVLASAITQHVISYTHGRDQLDYHASVTVPFENMHRAFEFGFTQDRVDHAGAWENFAVGGGMVAVCLVGRAIFFWWPLHAVGILLMDSWTVQAFWFSVCIGWWLKFLLLRYGGAPVFKRARPFFIGLIVGEIMAAGVWTYVALVSRGTINFAVFPR